MTAERKVVLEGPVLVAPEEVWRAQKALIDACHKQIGSDATKRGGGLSREVRKALARVEEVQAELAKRLREAGVEMGECAC